jgi:hypothetical protein
MTVLRRLIEALRGGVALQLYRVAAVIAPPGPGGAVGLDEAQRAWLLQDAREDLDGLIDDAENRRIGGRAAREMLAARVLIDWLEGGAPPDADAIELLERGLKRFPRRPSEDEVAQRDALLTAISDIRDEGVAASRPRQDPKEGWGDPRRYRRVIGFQGRRIRGLIEGRGLTLGEVSWRSGIDTVTLVSIVFGLEEMRFRESMGLSRALGVDLGWFAEGVTFIPDPAGGGEGVVVIDPALDPGSEEGTGEDR